MATREMPGRPRLRMLLTVASHAAVVSRTSRPMTFFAKEVADQRAGRGIPEGVAQPGGATARVGFDHDDARGVPGQRPVGPGASVGIVYTLTSSRSMQYSSITLEAPVLARGRRSKRRRRDPPAAAGCLQIAAAAPIWTRADCRGPASVRRTTPPVWRGRVERALRHVQIVLGGWGRGWVCPVAWRPHRTRLPDGRYRTNQR